jgi:Glycosyltransferase family 9 (heptosyltransferase)
MCLTTAMCCGPLRQRSLARSSWKTTSENPMQPVLDAPWARTAAAKVRALASLMPGRLRLLCVPGAERLFFDGLPLAAVYHTHHIRSAPSAEALDTAVTRLAAEIGECDLFLSFALHSNPSTLALVDALKPGQSIGHFPGFGTEISFDVARHVSDLAFAIPAALLPGLRVEDFVAPPKLPDAMTVLARKLRADLPQVRLLAVHADTKPEKMWAPERLAAVIGEFLGRHGDVVAIVVGAEPLKADIGRDRRRLLSCCDIPLAAAFAIVGECDIFLGIDSCMLHAADLYGVPGVGLFGPTNPLQFGFRFAPHRHVKAATMEESADYLSEARVAAGCWVRSRGKSLFRRGFGVSGCQRGRFKKQEADTPKSCRSKSDNQGNGQIQAPRQRRIDHHSQRRPDAQTCRDWGSIKKQDLQHSVKAARFHRGSMGGDGAGCNSSPA